MITKIHTYSFNLNDPAQREPYIQLSERLKAEIKLGKRGHCMNCIASFGDDERKHDAMVKAAASAGVLTLEPENLFDNQWNSTEAGRVFDWYEGIKFDNRLLKFGHYLEVTPEMDSIRRNTVKCGYTGEQFPADCGMAFNVTENGLCSYGLKESDLSMLRLLPVWPEGVKRKELTATERETILPLYIKAREKVNEAARVKARAEVEAEFAKDSALARTEYDGKIWLLDRGLSLENVIFYNHTARFNFGWRTSYGPVAAQSIRAALAGFPFDFDIQTEART